MENPTPTNANGPVKYCSTCGAQLHIQAEICPKCGVRQMPPPNAPQPPPGKSDKKGSKSEWPSVVICLACLAYMAFMFSQCMK